MCGKASLAPGLAFLLADRGLEDELQGAMGHVGAVTMNLFALLGDKRDDVRSVLSASPFSLNLAEESLNAQEMVRRRVLQAKVIDAWEAASCRVEQRRKLEADQRASSVPVTIMQADHISGRKFMRRTTAARTTNIFHPTT